MKTAKLIALTMAFALCCSCQKKRQAEDSSLVSAYKMIDAQRTDEAIVLLEAEIAKLKPESPDFIRYQVALASAYAHRAGIKVQRFSKLLQIGKIKVDFKLKVDQKAKSSAEAVDNFLNKLSSVLKGLSSISAVYTSVPSMSEKEEKNLTFALKILEGLDAKKMTPGDHVYRAVLRGIYLKHYISTQLFSDATMDVQRVTSCEINFNKFSPAVLAVAKVGIAIFDDLIYAQPSNKQKFLSSRQRLTEVASDLTTISTFASLLDDTSLILTKTTFVQTGLQNLLKCSDDNKPVITLPSLQSAL